MTRIRRRHTTSLIALLALLMAMLAPATAFAATGDADTDHGTDETAGSGDDAGSNESDTSDTTQTAEDDEAGQQASMSSRKSDTSDKRGFNDKHEGKAKGKDKAWTPTSGWGEATDAASFTTALTASFTSGATVTATSVPAGLAHTYEVSTEGPDTLTDAEATWSGKHLASWSGSAACDTTGGGTWTFKLDLKGLKLLDHSCDGDAATSGDGEGGDTGDGDGDDADEDDSDDESDKHCLDHSAAAYDKFNGAGTYTVDGVTFTVSGETVTVEGGDAELCVKAATGNSGTVALEDGESYTVDFLNGGGNNPAISYLVVYDVTPNDTAGDDEGSDEGSGGETDAVDADLALDAESVCVGDDIVFTATNDSDVKVLFKVEFGHKTVPFHLDAGETYTKDVPALVEGSWTLEWTATADGHEADSGTLTLVVDDCETEGDDTDGDDTDGDDTDGDEVDLPDHEWGDNVEICHRTRSATNPYRPIGPAVASIVKAGHGGHEGPIFDPATMTNGDTWGDIIPAFTYTDHKGDEHTFDGLNWPEGESVMEDGCVFGDSEAAAPAISIDKSADVAVVTLVGEDDTAEVTYTYEITNTGNVTLDLTELSDDKIADLDLGDLDDTTLDADESTTVTQVVDLGADDFDEDGEHTNVVTVTGVIEGGDATDTDDTVSDTDDETVTVIVEELPDVEPGVGSDGSTVDLGVTDLEVCVGSDVNLTLTTTATDDVDVTFAGDLDLDDTTMSATNPWTETLTGLAAGTYTIDYTVDLGNDSTAEGSFTITVEDCGDATPGVGGDGGTTDLGTTELDICPDGTATLSLASDSDEPLEVSFEGLDGYMLDEQFDDVTIGEGSPWTATLDELSVGTYRIRYTVHVGNGSYQTGVFDVTVEDCGDVEPGVGSDGSTVDLGVTDLEVCVGSDVNLTLTTTATDDVDVTFAGDLDLDDATMSATNPWTETLTGLAAGTYTIDYTVDLGLGSTETGSFTITVEDCGEVDDGVTEQPPVDEDEDDTPGTPSVPVDGDDEDDDTPATPADVDLDLELVCPDGVPSYVVTATGEGLEATEGVLSIAYGNTDVPFEAVTITLGDETELEWPIGIDDLDTSEFVVWVTVGETASEMVTLDTAEYDELCTEVLDEVIDAPDTGDTPATPDAPDDSEGPGTDIPVDNDEVVRDEEDEVLDVVLDQPADEVVSVDADDTISVGGSDEELAYTGSSLLALLMTGLVALFSGMGLLRRRS